MQDTNSSRARAALTAALLLSLSVVFSQRTIARDSEPPPLPEPTTIETGVPVYPGAKYDGVSSAGYSQNEHFYWFYLTADPIEKVVAFYQQELAPVPPEKMTDSYLFTLEKGGHVAFPNRGVMIEPNRLFPKPTKTIIMIIKLKPGAAE